MWRWLEFVVYLASGLNAVTNEYVKLCTERDHKRTYKPHVKCLGYIEKAQAKVIKKYTKEKYMQGQTLARELVFLIAPWN
jgi:aspartokinase